MSARNLLLQALHDADQPLHATALSKLLGLPMTTVHRTLKTLEQDGFITSFGSAIVQYRPIPRLAVEWTGQRQGKWFHHSWVHPHGFDARFPLVTAIPDPDVQTKVTTYLATSWDTGLFQPWLAAGEPRPSDRSHQVVIYGSAARGDLRPDSDIDMALFVRGADPPDTAAFRDLADQMNLATSRYLDLQVFTKDDPPPQALKASIQQEGIPVFDTGRTHA